MMVDLQVCLTSTKKMKETQRMTWEETESRWTLSARCSLSVRDVTGALCPY